jgi:hypothetical protein
MMPTATPATGQHRHRLAHAPRLASVLILVVGRVEEALVGLEREDQAGGVGEQQDERHADGQLLEIGGELAALGAGVGEAAARHQLEDGRHDECRGREQQHERLGARCRAIEDLTLALATADEHRGAHHEQDVAEDGSHDGRLDDLLEPLVESEEGDDELGRVAEGDVQEAADARARAGGQLLRRAAHQRRRRDHAERGRDEDDRRVGVRELERDRDRYERNQEVRPSVSAEKEAAQVEARLRRGGSHREQATRPCGPTSGQPLD